MPEPLKNQFGVDVPAKIAAMIVAVHHKFPVAAFVADALTGYESLELLPRAQQISTALHRHLPRDYEKAADILLASLGSKLEGTENHGMAPFIYMPHVCFVRQYGLDDFDTSMRANYELTQRFTAEFSIRPFLERYPEQTLARLETWTEDSSPHVRRLVSEGTRPRLPWASRLKCFQKNPRPVLALLELLKDDPVLYVRRSVANNLNDIGKDHPEQLYKTARCWLKGASTERQWLVKHALRSAIKRAEPGALEILGLNKRARVAIFKVKITPRRPGLGEAVSISCVMHNSLAQRQQVLVDLRVHFIKASGKSSARVFKLKTVDLAPREAVVLTKTLSLADKTTRKHYPGKHRLELLLNGETWELGDFMLILKKPQ